MAIENLPRPWVLAALTGLRIAELAALPVDPQPPSQPPPARPPARRRQLRDAARDYRQGSVIEGRFG